MWTAVAPGQQLYVLIILLAIGILGFGVLTVLEIRYRRARRREAEEDRRRVKKYPPFE
jgi:hypothetical protein